ncbi:MAG: DUF448 domain-containing protein, partial [Alphaproteobacteria bacterium]
MVKALKSTERMCCVTRENFPQEALLRFVSDGTRVWFDATGKAQGRGAYVQASRAMVEQAVAKKHLSRALEAHVPADLFAQVEHQLRTAALKQLGLAKKAGKLTIGVEGVGADRSHVTMLILAADAGQTAQEKLSHWPVPTCTLFTKAELEKALAIPNC